MPGNRTAGDVARLRGLLLQGADALGEGLAAIQRSLAALDTMQPAGAPPASAEHDDGEGVGSAAPSGGAAVWAPQPGSAGEH